MLSRRQFALTAAAGTAALAAAPAAAKGAATATKVEGPVTGGERGTIHGAYFGDLAAHGYVEEEYFVSGTAQSFRPVGELSKDGRWTVAPDARASYRTRVIVHRPIDPAKFNGVVMCEWTNVSTFNDLSNAVNESFWQSGYAYAAVSAQKVGIDGLDAVPDSGLKRWDGERYGSLVHPGDAFSYDIFTQVARALVSAKGRSGPDPLGGLAAKHVIATGESQSAARLATYINAVHPLAGFFSAFIPCVLVGGGSELENPEIIPGESAADYNKRFFSRIVETVIRDDLDVPVLIMLSETEARMFRVPPQPDGPKLRLWEVAGSVHGSACDTGYRPSVAERDGIRDSIGGSDQRMVRFMPTMAAAGLAMIRWREGGDPLARHPRLLRGATPRDIVTDVQGNALGGARLPEVAAPTAAFDTKTSPARGNRHPLSEEALRRLYPADADYANAVRAAVDAALRGDLILPYRAEEYLAEAAKGPVAAG
ncbi:MAG TPA: alpha/beta hydrolase domain-containing protein [Sphingopyxis sp.]|nr:alpha/beta hydrolase domain-containing protein [Sphingopyxis sp.]HMP46261.1 alpha/beta hydrolase domain-containing protein [Sphingopyxis sp.]HMQ18028.1 alpha/beta hydrolase domain-containing protein [Sphingopyxis sp.]